MTTFQASQVSEFSKAPDAIQTPRVGILLSTYNGEKYLAEQLDSLLSQSYSNVLIVVRDDGSSDGTVGIIEDYLANHANHFHFVNANEDGEGSNNLGASGSFSFLLQYALDNKEKLGLTQAYLMFCDQDDVWFTRKIELQMRRMLEVEAENSSDVPILVHSDLQVVAEDKSLISRSMARYQGLETKRNGFTQITVSNLVTGCTALLNESLARKALPVSDQAIMHDWWLAMVAAAFGKLQYLDEPTVYYRQHGRNTIGAKEHQQGKLTRLGHLARVLSLSPNPHLLEVARQANAFAQRYGAELEKFQQEGLVKAEKLNNSIGLLQRLAYRRVRNH